MTNQEFKNLIKKYLSGKITQSEKTALFNEYDSKQSDQYLWDSQLMGERSDISSKVHVKIMEKIEMKNSVRNSTRSFLKIAASLLLLASIGFYFYTNHQNNSEELVIQEQNILPGGDKAILILENGDKLSLNDLKNGEVIEQGDGQFKKDKDGHVSYHLNNKSPDSRSKEVFNTIQTPRGGQYMVLLSDGTKVWLNAFSSLRYPTVFSSDKRVVELSGEGYFEVAKNKKPFLVKTNKQEIEVLGTHFNVQNYDDELSQQVTLLEGSVKVMPTTLKNSVPVVLAPGQQALLSSKLSVHQVDINETIAWKNGYFQFVDSDLETVMRQLSRWFDVDVVYKDGKSSNKHFSGKINRDIEIQHIFEMLRYFEVKFKIEGRTIIVQS